MTAVCHVTRHASCHGGTMTHLAHPCMWQIWRTHAWGASGTYSARTVCCDGCRAPAPCAIEGQRFARALGGIRTARPETQADGHGSGHLPPEIQLAGSCATLLVQWSEDVIKADPFFRRSRVRFRVPPWVSNTIARDHLA